MFNRTQKVHSVISSLKDGHLFYMSIYSAGIRSPQTWRNWEIKHPRLKKIREMAQEIGASKRVGIVEDALFKAARGGNVGACAFYLKNKAGWKDSPAVIVETGTQVKTPHAIIFSSVKDECRPQLPIRQ